MNQVPICGYCGLPEQWHAPQDHPFDAVGGSLKAVDLSCGPRPDAERKWSRPARIAFLASATCGLWGALILFFVARRIFFHS